MTVNQYQLKTLLVEEEVFFISLLQIKLIAKSKMPWYDNKTASPELTVISPVRFWPDKDMLL